jgi:hypothetical protein
MGLVSEHLIEHIAENGVWINILWRHGALKVTASGNVGADAFSATGKGGKGSERHARLVCLKAGRLTIGMSFPRFHLADSSGSWQISHS